MNENNLLVIIDMQKGFINENIEHLVEDIAEFIEQQWDGDVVATRYINHTETACYKFEGWKDCMAGSPESELVEPIDKLVNIVFDKDKYSCWNEEFKSFVKSKGYDKLYFVGVNTGCCVLHSAFDAYSDLQDCCVISDLCGSGTSEASHQIALQVLRECITKERVI